MSALSNARVLHVEADQVVPRLWQGSMPPMGRAVHLSGFRHLVLTACEYQPPSTEFPGVSVARAVLDDADHPPTDRELHAALKVANWVRQRMQTEDVLTTCALGLNRSGLVNALALVLDGHDPDEAIGVVRAARARALGNPYFVDYIRSFR